MRNLLLLLLFAATGSGLAQTNVAAGNVYGTWKKTGSPYKINGQISVPKDSTLHIEAGVKVEFQGAYMMHVYGSIQALGKTNDTVVFTPANKSTGWQGIHIHKNKAGADSNLFAWCKFEYAKYFKYILTIKDAFKQHGAILLDSTNNVRISNSLFIFNTSNSGSAIAAAFAKLNIFNCTFYKNYATDERGVSATGVGASAVGVGYSTANISNCIFLNNLTSIPNNPDDSMKAMGGSPMVAGASNLTMNNCFFSKNKSSGCSGLTLTFENNITFNVSNCKFIDNYSMTRPVVYFGYETGLTNAKAFFTNIVIENNKKGSIYGPPNPDYSSIASGFESAVDGKIIIDGLKHINQDGYCGFKSWKESINNMILTGSDTIGIYNASTTSTNKMTITNSIIANNGIGMYITDGTKVLMANCLVTNNGGNGSDGLGGLHMSYGAPSYKIFNSIIQRNRCKGKMTNILGHPGAKVLDYLKNSILEGGLDSIQDFQNQSTVFTATNLSNLYKDTVSFVKAPKGVGPAFYDTTNDFHLRNTCSYVNPGLNKGLNTVYDGSTTINFANTTDLDGNPRIKCGTIDIGPFELEGSKQTVSIDQEPTDQKICPKTAVVIAPTACGASLDYQWQKSSTSATTGFANIGSATGVNYTFTPKDSGWYRLIINQAECSKKDTSIAAKISFKPGSSIVISAQPRDTNICANTTFNLNATVQGSNNTSRWQNSKTSATTGFADIAGATTNPYSKKILDSSWYRLIVKNTICNYEDTTKAAKVNKLPLPTPNLGADQTLANTANKVLNPGTFTTYQWSHPTSAPATTPTLTVDKNNLIVGANKVWVEVSNSYGCKGRDTINITLEAANGVLNPATAGIGIYPVPMQNQLHMTLPESLHTATYQISNLAGQVLVNGIISQTKAIDVSSLSAGSYILTIQVEGSVYGVKVVK